MTSHINRLRNIQNRKREEEKEKLFPILKKDAERSFGNSYVIDVDSLIQEEEQKEQELNSFDDAGDFPKVTIDTDRDPRVSSLKQWSAPTINFIEIKKNLVLSPYISINWSMKRSDIKNGKIVSFKVYRKKYSRSEARTLPQFSQDLKHSLMNPFNIAKMTRNVGHNSNQDFGSISDIIEVDSIPKYIANFNLNIDNRGEQVLETPQDYSKLFRQTGFEEIANVNIQTFLRKEERRMVSVNNKNILNMRFEDKNVQYNGVYEYFLTSINDQGEDSSRSEKIILKVDDRISIPAPTLYVRAKSPTSNLLTVIIPKDFNISKILFFRKEGDFIETKYFGSNDIYADFVQKIDSNIKLGQKYLYRVFLVDIFGEISEPAEYVITPAVKNIAPFSRFNNLREPILKTEQAEGSTNCSIRFFPNDNRVQYYKLERKDLRIKEREYSVPSKDTTGYGGTGWENGGIFFVKRVAEQRKKINSNYIDINDVQQVVSGLDTTNFTGLSRDNSGIYYIDASTSAKVYINQNKEEINNSNYAISAKEIVFVDTTTTAGHTYSYRLVGYDLFNNPTKYAFSLISIESSAATQKAESIRYQVIRKKPLRIKLIWNHQIKSGIKFTVQRRKEGERQYQTFPDTESSFIIDEVKSNDFIDFITGKREVDYTPPENEEGGSSIPLTEIKRPRNVPDFLEENSIYYYRITSETQLEGRGNPTDEVRVITYPEVSRPINLVTLTGNVKVRPIFVKLSWEMEDISNSFKPDKFVIERKIDTSNSRFVPIGESYLATHFFDYGVEFGTSYIYRVVSRDIFGREKTSDPVRFVLV